MATSQPPNIAALKGRKKIQLRLQLINKKFTSRVCVVTARQERHMKECNKSARFASWERVGKGKQDREVLRLQAACRCRGCMQRTGPSRCNIPLLKHSSVFRPISYSFVGGSFKFSFMLRNIIFPLVFNTMHEGGMAAWGCDGTIPCVVPCFRNNLATHQNSAVEDSKGGVAPLVVVVSTRAVQ
ncbi:hypothetical protein GWK47_039680 [Chionoecetes opilio]|uniref:Uncharacterized protein n=1 Tax=Chionoecetes opilio TaxID=41210 RepID=A0A8J5CLH8_CHIOP|nr:hypothetical protein GWK47_039680 [Chionoecetes opilio]